MDSWEEQSAELQVLGKDLLAALAERQRRAVTGGVKPQHDDAIRRDAAEYSRGLEALRDRLAEDELLGDHSSPAEAAKRKADLALLGGQWARLEALVAAQLPRPGPGLGPGSGPGAVPSALDAAFTPHKAVHFAPETHNMHDGELLEVQSNLIANQDSHLDELAETLGRQKELGSLISDELEQHVILLDDIDTGVDRTSTNLRRTGGRLGQFRDSLSQSFSFTWTIIVLVIILLVVIIIARKL